jgi:hypothetical protein
MEGAAVLWQTPGFAFGFVSGWPAGAGLCSCIICRQKSAAVSGTGERVSIAVGTARMREVAAVL